MKCNLCPRNCNVDRELGEKGYCLAPSSMVIARYSLHPWEEPVLSGEKGSGTIFFSYCNLRCCFCQNYEISELHKGRVVTVEEFCDICLDLQDSGACNINLVTPTMYVPLIIQGLKMAREKGLVLPIVYNTSGYEKVETIRMLEGYVDIYLPDLKYYDEELGKKYSRVEDYFSCASLAIEEMVRQVGPVVIGEDGLMKRGVIVRQMMMPRQLEDSKKIISYLYLKYGHTIFISIMNQYTPVRELEYVELNEMVCERDYEVLIDYAYDLGVRKAFVQEGGTQMESFVPDFNIFRDIS